MKQIIWYPHAQERLIERGIDKKLVMAAITKPDQSILAGKYTIFHKRYYDSNLDKEYLLRIFAEEYAHKYIIYSVYRTSKISKYWRDDL